MTAAVRILRSVLVVTVLAAVVAGCAYRGSDNPIARKFSWFSYLNADDLRAACKPGATRRHRFVYNAIYSEQVRTYDLVADADGAGARMDVRVIGEANLLSLEIGRISDLLNPWRGTVAAADLSAAHVVHLERALAESGAYAEAPAGMRLKSTDFFWVVAACTGGQFHFNAYRWPSPRFDGAAFADLLFAWDGTGVPVNRPRRTSDFQLYRGNDRDGDSTVQEFELMVGKGGLRGVSPLF